MATSLLFTSASVDFEFDFTATEGGQARRDYPGLRAEVAITNVRMNGIAIPIGAINTELYGQMVQSVIDQQSRYCSACPHLRPGQLPLVGATLFKRPQMPRTVQSGSPLSVAAQPRQSGISGPITTPVPGAISVSTCLPNEPAEDVSIITAYKIADTLNKRGLLLFSEAYQKALYALRLLAGMSHRPVAFAYIDSDGKHRKATGYFGAAPLKTSTATRKLPQPDAPVRSYYDLEVQDWRSFRIDRLILD